MNKYLQTDQVSRYNLSRMAYALILPLMLLSDKGNEINKKRFTKSVGWVKDYRTWNKYWIELEEKGILVRLSKKIWMISPNECYTDGVSQTGLITKWNEAHNAVS